MEGDMDEKNLMWIRWKKLMVIVKDGGLRVGSL